MHMIDRAKGTGRQVYRCAPGGTTRVMIDRFLPDGRLCFITNRIGQHWALSGMEVPLADLFETKDEALAEFRARRKSLVQLIQEGR